MAKRNVDKDKILALKKAGKENKEIAQELGYSVASVIYHTSEKSYQYKKQYNADTRRKITKTIQKIKTDSGCVDCGGKFDHFILEFDHLPQYEKSGSPTEIGSKLGIKAALEEIKKCDIICANCHKARTWKRAGWET